MYNSVVFSLFTELCNHRHYLILKHFHHPRKKPLPISRHFPLPPPAGNTYLLSVSINWLCQLWTCHVNKIIYYVVLLLASFVLPNNIPLCGYSSIDGHVVVSTFGLLWIVLLWTLRYKVLCRHMFSMLSSVYLAVELLGHVVALTLWGTTKLFPVWLHILRSHQHVRGF